jgi:hypothetical protein
MRVVLAIAGVWLLASPVAAIEAGATTVSCAAALTTGIGSSDQQLRDLEPSYLPVLAYAALPGEGDFKQLTKIDGVPVRLYVYRVNETLMHLQIFEQHGNEKGVLADTPLAGDMTELTWRSLGSSEMVTVYCY